MVITVMLAGTPYCLPSQAYCSITRGKKSATSLLGCLLRYASIGLYRLLVTTPGNHSGPCQTTSGGVPADAIVSSLACQSPPLFRKLTLIGALAAWNSSA